MCYHYEFRVPLKELAGDWKLEVEPWLLELPPIFETFNGFNRPEAPVIIEQHSQKLITQMRWGLVPAWIRDGQSAEEISLKTLNARAETLLEKPSFKSVETKRCLIPATDFFEWKHIGKKTLKHRIHYANSPYFFMAGLYDEWMNPETGEAHQTFSIITTEANELMRDIHNTKFRMPLIPQINEAFQWLSADWKALIHPLQDGILAAEPIYATPSAPTLF